MNIELMSIIHLDVFLIANFNSVIIYYGFSRQYTLPFQLLFVDLQRTQIKPYLFKMIENNWLVQIFKYLQHSP